LSRQTLPKINTSSRENTELGAYAVLECEHPDIILVATGSEVSLALDAAEVLKPLQVRVVSMPSCELFRKQSKKYREELLPRSVPKMSIEMTTTYAWMELVDGCVGLNRFGTSAPGPQCAEYFGFNVSNVADCAKRLLAGERGTLSDGCDTA